MRHLARLAPTWPDYLARTGKQALRRQEHLQSGGNPSGPGL